jgi:hypothetical protein
MADNKKQPVSFDDIIKAGKQNRAQACAELTTDHTTRPPKAQERAARARHLRQKPSPERSRSWQPQEGTHWRQSGQPSRSKQSKSIPSMIIRLHFADDHISAQLQSLARIARHLATAVVQQQQPSRRQRALEAGSRTQEQQCWKKGGRSRRWWRQHQHKRRCWRAISCGGQQLRTWNHRGGHRERDAKRWW